MIRPLIRHRPPIRHRVCLSTSTVLRYVNETFVTHKSTDRLHRELYNTLGKYKKELAVDLSIRHLLVLLQSERRGKPVFLKPLSLPTPYKPHKLVEPLLFHIILSVHYLDDNSKHAIQQSKRQKYYLILVLKKIRPPVDDSSVLAEMKLTANHIVQSVSSKQYTMSEPLELALLCLHYLKVSIDDLPLWILSLTSPNVTSSCLHLSGLTKIPPFVLADILLRTPMSNAELHLQLDIWFQFMKTITTAFLEKTSHLKACFNNLIFYCICYDTSILKKLIASSFTFFHDTTSGIKVKAFDDSFINETLWDIAITSILKSNSNESGTSSNVISSQEMLVNFLSKSSDGNVNQRLELKAYLGIALAIEPKAKVKSDLLVQIAENKFFTGKYSVGKKEILAYNVTKVLLASSPEELLNAFNSAAKQQSNSSLLWLGFIYKLKSFDLLNETRSIRIIQELLKIKDKIIISKDIVSTLIQSFKGLNLLDQFISSFAKEPELLMTYSKLILPVYISMLYKNHNSTHLSQKRYPWDTTDFGKNGYKGFDSVAAYARHLYFSQFDKKSSRIVGVFLQGEAVANPQQVYGLYKQELEANDLLPTESCLLGLIRAALKGEDDDIIMWDNLYAPQVVVHEFKNRILPQDDQSIFPSDNLWKQYIQMLHKYGYISELADIIHQWEELQFTPSHDSLLVLMASLPEDYGARYIQHINKLDTDSERFGLARSTKWNWPSKESLDKFKQKDKRYHKK